MRTIAISVVVALGIVGSDLSPHTKVAALGVVAIVLLGKAIEAVAEALRWGP